MDTKLKITTRKDELREGLFGGIFLYIFELLPYLHSNSIFPAWDIKSLNYGKDPDFTIVPGVLDLAYSADSTCDREISFTKLHRKQGSVLGSDWQYLNKLWNAYFKIPQRVVIQADKLGDLSETIGVHYRGTDKNLAGWDTNAVSQEDYIILLKDFLASHRDVSTAFIATDEYSFVEKFKLAFPGLGVINLGEVEPHLQAAVSATKADRAVLDCLVLSRCRYMLKTSSALSAFAKVLNPDLECYRVTASKLFSDVPYFPVAYIPKLSGSNPQSQAILKRLFTDDWLQNKQTKEKYKHPFSALKRDKTSFLLREVERFSKRVANKISKALVS